MYSPQKLPWDALVYGAVHVDGSFHQPLDLKAGGDLTLAPAASGEPVNGHVTAAWDARAHTLDLGRSSVSLPHSRIDLSGAVGAQLRVHLETSELDDLLPAIGKRAADLPVKLNHGTVVFDGSVTGNLAAPRLVGHLRATSLVLSGEAADAFEGDVIAAPSLIRLQDGTVSRGTLRAQLQGSVVLSEWKTQDHQPDRGYGVDPQRSAAGPAGHRRREESRCLRNPRSHRVPQRHGWRSARGRRCRAEPWEFSGRTVRPPHCARCVQRPAVGTGAGADHRRRQTGPGNRQLHASPRTPRQRPSALRRDHQRDGTGIHSHPASMAERPERHRTGERARRGADRFRIEDTVARDLAGRRVHRQRPGTGESAGGRCAPDGALPGGRADCAPGFHGRRRVREGRRGMAVARRIPGACHSFLHEGRPGEPARLDRQGDRGHLWIGGR